MPMNKILNVYMRDQYYEIEYTDNLVEVLPIAAACFYHMIDHMIYVYNKNIYLKKNDFNSYPLMIEFT